MASRSATQFMRAAGAAALTAGAAFAAAARRTRRRQLDIDKLHQARIDVNRAGREPPTPRSEARLELQTEACKLHPIRMSRYDLIYGVRLTPISCSKSTATR